MELRILIQKLRPICLIHSRYYSQYPNTFVQPIYRESDQERILSDKSTKNVYDHTPIKAARRDESSTIFHDIVISKFVNYIMQGGRKQVAKDNLMKTFIHIKKIQIERYHKASPEEKDKIITDPLKLLKLAITNVRPMLKLCPIKKGGSIYQIPAPVTDSESLFRGMRWIVLTCRNKDGPIPFYVRLAQEIMDAAENKGSVVKKKIDLHKQCEANRAYAHYRWT